MKSDRIRLSDFLIINIPAFLFLLLVPAGAFIFVQGSGRIGLAGIPFAVWGVSGSVLLLADYFQRKKRLFLRVLSLYDAKPSKGLSLYMKSTLCGLTLLWAVSARQKKYRRSL